MANKSGEQFRGNLTPKIKEPYLRIKRNFIQSRQARYDIKVLMQAHAAERI